MTKETKIGLLVGLVFIIVLGVVISDHFTTNTAPQPALLLQTAGNVISSTTTPGQRGTRDGAFTIPNNVTPDHPLDVRQNRRAQGTASVTISPGDPRNNRNDNTSSGTGTDNPIPPRPFDPPPVPPVNNDADSVTVREYVAQTGDNLYRMAAKFLGAPSKANQDLIIKANPSLAAAPHRVIAGETYRIPVTSTRTSPGNTAVDNPTRPTPPVPDANKPIVAGNSNPRPAEVSYTTKPGDNLWKIAMSQCGSGSTTTVNQIMALNNLPDDRIHPNMVLKLPRKAN